MKLNTGNIGKPFIKWAGGKTQLLTQIDRIIPSEFRTLKFTYIEPFVGGGAMLFHILNNYPNLEEIVINDINTDLANTYKTIKNEATKLIQILLVLQSEYYTLLKNEAAKKEFYYQKREHFNKRTSNQIEQAALFIFLNKTCFNGLYRVNRKNEFNVPIGSYKKPRICDRENLLKVSELLQKVTILNADFEETLVYAKQNSLFYFDPPYKPLSETSSFNSYAKAGFNDKEQIRLANFCEKIDALGHTWILSNSDVKGKNPEDNFFDDLFRKFEINRVLAKRSINSNAKKRGQLKELLITNSQKKNATII